MSRLVELTTEIKTIAKQLLEEKKEKLMQNRNYKEIIRDIYSSEEKLVAYIETTKSECLYEASLILLDEMGIKPLSNHVRDNIIIIGKV